MNPLDYNWVATALARYVRDFLPAPAHGVAVIQQDRDQDALLAVYGKSDSGGKAELSLYEDLLAKARVEIVGRAVVSRGAAWAVLVQAGRLVQSLKSLLADLLERRVAGVGAGERSADESVADERVRLWSDWWYSRFMQRL
ncbi:MAG TPA: hypothetical protein VKE40_24375 [Gemmataceae bacterium]|nr:hypothetical protein [Gemmataceae bacterium]